MKRRLFIISIIGIVVLCLSGCQNQNVLESHSDALANPVNQAGVASSEINYVSDNQANDVFETKSQGLPNTNLVSFWDDYAKSYGGSKASFSEMPMNADLLPLYIAGMQHKDSYVRWSCAYKAFDYHWDARKPDIIRALKPLLNDPVQQVREAAEFSTEILSETFSGPEFVHSPNGKDVAFCSFLNTRFNDGKLWVYSGETRQISMVLQLVSVGGDGGVAGYIHWSPDGSRLAVGDGGRLWSNTVILKLATLTANKQELFSYLGENSGKFGYKIGGYQRSDPSVRFLEWSPDSKKVLLSYYFAEDMEKWQSGYAVYNCEKDKYERIMPNKCSNDGYPKLEKPADFQWSGK